MWLIFKYKSFFHFYIIEWKEATVTSAHVLKLIHQGRFLHGSVSIGGKL